MLKLNRDSSSKISYKFYATLLDSYVWYLKSEYDTAYQEFLDKLNRVPYVSTEAAEMGTSFNQLVDAVKNGDIIVVNENGFTYNKVQPKPKADILITDGKGLLTYTGQKKNDAGEMVPMTTFQFKWNVVRHFAEMFVGSIDQLYIEAVLPTPRGNVLLYGFIDEVMPNYVSDIKTGKSYDFPKFLHNWQQIVYPYCLNANGIYLNTFRYDITDFSNTYQEEYEYQEERDKAKLVGICMDLIHFLETNRHKITDRKLFALDASKEAATAVA